MITVWYVASAVHGSPEHTHYHMNGWEPFAVTGWADQTTIWFRMSAQRDAPDDPRTQPQD